MATKKSAKKSGKGFGGKGTSGGLFGKGKPRSAKKSGAKKKGFGGPKTGGGGFGKQEPTKRPAKRKA